jgi:TP901 family phage tail tape measure protein
MADNKVEYGVELNVSASGLDEASEVAEAVTDVTDAMKEQIEASKALTQQENERVSQINTISELEKNLIDTENQLVAAEQTVQNASKQTNESKKQDLNTLKQVAAQAKSAAQIEATAATEAVANAKQKQEAAKNAAAVAQSASDTEKAAATEAAAAAAAAAKEATSAAQQQVNKATEAANAYKEAESNVSSAMQEASKETGNLGDAFTAADAKATVLFEKVIDLAEKAISKMVDLAGDVIDLGSDFEYSIAKAETLTQGLLSTDELDAEARKLATTYAQDVIDIAESEYNALSAGIDTSELFDFEDINNKLAVAGSTTADIASEGLLSVINAYNLGVEDFEKLANAELLEQDYGRVPLDELAQSIGQVASVASIAGVSYEDMLAAIASISNQTGDASQTMTDFSSVLNSVITDFSIDAIKQQGLTDWLAQVDEAIGDDADALSDLFGSKKSFQGVAILTSDTGLEQYNKYLDALGSGVDKVQENFDALSETASYKMQNLSANLQTLQLGVYDAVEDPFKDFIDYLNDKVGTIVEYINSEVGQEKISETIDKVTERLENLIDNVLTGDNLDNTLDLVTSFIEMLANNGVTLLDDILKILSDVIPMLAEAADFIAENTELVEGLAAAFAALKIASEISNIITAVTKLGPAVTDVVSSISSVLTTIGPKIATVLTTDITTLVASIKAGATTALASIKTAASSALSTIASKSSAILYAVTPVTAALAAITAAAYVAIQKLDEYAAKVEETADYWENYSSIDIFNERDSANLLEYVNEFKEAGTEAKEAANGAADYWKSLEPYISENGQALIDSYNDAQDYLQGLISDLDAYEARAEEIFADGVLSDSEALEYQKLQEMFNQTKSEIERVQKQIDYAEPYVEGVKECQKRFAELEDSAQDTADSVVDATTEAVEAATATIEGVITVTSDNISELISKQLTEYKRGQEDALTAQEAVWDKELTDFKRLQEDELDAKQDYYDDLLDQAKAYYDAEVDAIDAASRQREYDEVDADIAETQAKLAKYGSYDSLVTSSDRKAYKSLQDDLADLQKKRLKMEQSDADDAAKDAAKASYEAKKAAIEEEQDYEIKMLKRTQEDALTAEKASIEAYKTAYKRAQEDNLTAFKATQTAIKNEVTAGSEYLFDPLTNAFVKACDAIVSAAADAKDKVQRSFEEAASGLQAALENASKNLDVSSIADKIKALKSDWSDSVDGILDIPIIVLGGSSLSSDQTSTGVSSWVDYANSIKGLSTGSGNTYISGDTTVEMNNYAEVITPDLAASEVKTVLTSGLNSGNY